MHDCRGQIDTEQAHNFTYYRLFNTLEWFSTFCVYLPSAVVHVLLYVLLKQDKREIKKQSAVKCRDTGRGSLRVSVKRGRRSWAY